MAVSRGAILHALQWNLNTPTKQQAVQHDKTALIMVKRNVPACPSSYRTVLATESTLDRSGHCEYLGHSFFESAVPMDAFDKPVVPCHTQESIMVGFRFGVQHGVHHKTFSPPLLNRTRQCHVYKHM